MVNVRSIMCPNSNFPLKFHMKIYFENVKEYLFESYINIFTIACELLLVNL